MRYLTILLFLTVAIAECAFSQASPKKQIRAIRDYMTRNHKDIDWDAYDTTSTVSIDSLNFQALQGVWKAYNGIFKFNGSVNSMALTTPLVLQFKDDSCRHDLKDEFNKFTITKNYFESQDGAWHGYINSISDKLLVITLNMGENRTRYYYEK